MLLVLVYLWIVLGRNHVAWKFGSCNLFLALFMVCLRLINQYDCRPKWFLSILYKMWTPHLIDAGIGGGVSLWITWYWLWSALRFESLSNILFSLLLHSVVVDEGFLSMHRILLLLSLISSIFVVLDIDLVWKYCFQFKILILFVSTVSSMALCFRLGTWWQA